MSANEQELLEVATGSGWELSSLPQLSGAHKDPACTAQLKLETEQGDYSVSAKECQGKPRGNESTEWQL